MSGARGPSRRRFCTAAAATVAAAPLGVLGLPERSNAMPAIAQAGTDRTAIRPFQVNVPEAQLVELRRRINATRWPDRETVADDSQGVQLATMQALAKYWTTDYDWGKCEAQLNAQPQFLTEIDGLDIHFIHARSKHADALPLIVTHGWPGSVVEQLKIIDPLTDPTAYGGSAADAFHVVIPSIPGYGFSGIPSAMGWDPEHIGRAWVVLMKRLGYDRFVAQGGDVGSLVSNLMAEQAPPELLGIHVNLPGVVPADVAMTPPGSFSPEEMRALKQLGELRSKHFGYFIEMSLRPQTLYGIADSPIGLAAWMLDHDAASYEHIARAFAGEPGFGLSRDDVLDNITLTWLTNTAVSGARLYWENKGRSVAGAVNVSIPAAVSVFPEEIYQAPRSWTERAYHKLVYYNQLDKGGHFAAWEQPQLFTEELRAGFRPLRKGAQA